MKNNKEEDEDENQSGMAEYTVAAAQSFQPKAFDLRDQKVTT